MLQPIDTCIYVSVVSSHYDSLHSSYVGDLKENMTYSSIRHGDSDWHRYVCRIMTICTCITFC